MRSIDRWNGTNKSKLFLRWLSSDSSVLHLKTLSTKLMSVLLECHHPVHLQAKHTPMLIYVMDITQCFLDLQLVANTLVLMYPLIWSGTTNLIEYLCERASEKLSKLKSWQFTICRKSLETAYLSFIRPSLEYANTVWAGAHEKDFTQLNNPEAEAMHSCSYWYYLWVHHCRSAQGHRLGSFQWDVHNPCFLYKRLVSVILKQVPHTQRNHRINGFNINSTRIPSVVGEKWHGGCPTP